MDSESRFDKKMAKVDQPAMLESHVQTALVINSSASSTNSAKISMFKAKSGFVIPKNKLSGSLVPTFRGMKKSEDSDAANEESFKQMQRKTRWGPDLTQDASVRRGRAFAYQTRVEQITKLKLGSLWSGDLQHSRSSENVSGHELSSHQTENQEKLHHLDLEKQEAIGEILKLNPSYKVPADYKPLMKEATFPLPVKEHPGYVLVGLVFGPGSDTQKRLEKETGARIQVYGAKTETGEKVEVMAYDGSEVLGSYAELYVQISADSYEKVDAAFALIELLVASVSGKSAVSRALASVSGDDPLAVSKAQETSTAVLTSVGMQSQVLVQPVSGPVPIPQGQFQPFPASPWIPTGPTHASPALRCVPNSSSPSVNNPVYPSPFPFNPLNMISSYGLRPASSAGFGSAPQTIPNMPPKSQPPMQVFQHPLMPPVHPLGQIDLPRNPHVPAPLSFPAQPNNSAPLPGTNQQPMAVVSPRVAGPLTAHPISNVPFRGLPQIAWAGPPAVTPQSLGSTVHIAPPLVSSLGPHAAVSQPVVTPTTPASSPAVSGVPRPSLQVGSSSTASLIPRPLHGPVFVPPQTQPSSAVPVQPFAPKGPVFNSSPNTAVGPAPVPSPSPSTPCLSQVGMPSSVSTNIPLSSFAPVNSMAGASPRPQQPISGNFTFQPHRPSPPQPSHPAPGPSNQSASQNSPLSLLKSPPAPQGSPFQPALQNSAPQPLMQSHPWPQTGDQMGQHPAVPSASFRGMPGNFRPMNSNLLHMGPRNLGPVSPHLLNVGGPLPPRPGNSLQFQPNQMAAPLAQPHIIISANQKFGSILPMAAGTQPASSSLGGQEIYYPFSPTSVSASPQQRGSNRTNIRKLDSDPEYEDLLASVGLK